jgi:hypothetical protein
MNMNCPEAVPGTIHDRDTFMGQSKCELREHVAIMNLKQLMCCTAAV